MKTIKMGDRAKRASGKVLPAGEVARVDDNDARVLIRSGFATLVEDHGPDETPDAKRRKSKGGKRAAKKTAGGKSDGKSKPADGDADGQSGDDAGKGEESLL